MSDSQARDFDLDVSTRNLTVAGRTERLDKRSAALLSAFIHSPDGRVSKSALLEAGWPGQLVHENSLAKAIGRLRSALAGSGHSIAAEYGFGYRLERGASDRALGDAEQERGFGDDSTVEHPKKNGRSLARWVIATVVILGLALVGSLQLRSPASSRTSQIGGDRPKPITNDAPDALGAVLWVDDHPVNNALEVAELRKRRIAVHLAETTEDAMNLLAINRYRVVVSDLGRGDDRLAGTKMVETMRKRGDRTPFIIYTVRPNTAEGQRAQRELVCGAGATGLAVTPEEIRRQMYATFGIEGATVSPATACPSPTDENS